MGDSVVIGARRFATVYGAFWQSIAPTCDLFVRRINTYGYERWCGPLEGPPDGARRSLTAEYAFSQFSIRFDIRSGVISALSEKEIHTRAWQEAIERLSPYAEQGLNLGTQFSEEERADASELGRRLERFFARYQDRVTTRPCFPGCGYVDISEGDVIVGSTLFEVKTVDRMIRSIDLRQLLTYAALNKSAGGFELNGIGLFNPRRGIVAEFSLDEVCLGVSGNTAEVLLSEIIATISSGDMSH